MSRIRSFCHFSTSAEMPKIIEKLIIISNYPLSKTQTHSQSSCDGITPFFNCFSNNML